MIVTVSRAYGAASLAVCRVVAERLGYRLVSHELPVVVAARLGMSSETVETASDRSRSFGERVLAQLGGGVPETVQPANPAGEELAAETRRAIERAVREFASAGDVVINGRMASAVLGPRADVLRVFVGGALDWRVARLVAAHGCHPAEARAEIARVDEARRTYAKEQYRVQWGDARAYDMLLDVSRLGVEGAAGAIVAAVRAAGA